LDDELARDVLYSLGYFDQHYTPAGERPESAVMYGRLTQRFPQEWSYRHLWLQTAVDYGQPDVMKAAANHYLQAEAPYNVADAWYRLMVAAERNKDVDLAKRTLAHMRAQQQKFGVDHSYATQTGDALQRLGLEADAVAYWTEHAAPTMNGLEPYQCSSRLLARITDPAQRLAFAEQRFNANTDFSPGVCHLGDRRTHEVG